VRKEDSAPRRDRIWSSLLVAISWVVAPWCRARVDDWLPRLNASVLLVMAKIAKRTDFMLLVVDSDILFFVDVKVYSKPYTR